MGLREIDIRPGVSVLAVLRHLNYKPWFALGEFVDNSVESFLTHKAALEAVHGPDVRLVVHIDIDATPPARIRIRDNAAGIFESEYERAFRAAAIPPDRSGLSEFGMGMKSAACWFAPRWSVRTSALGEPIVRTIHFDIATIVQDDLDSLTIDEAPEAAEAHYTEVILEDVYHAPVRRTLGKLKEHLTDIYRDFVRKGVLELRFNDEQLHYSAPKILHAPYYRTPEGPVLEWRKDIEFDFGEGLSVSGFAALRETANTAKAGFALFRRGRVIQGSGDEGYRPQLIFGSSNSYRYQRLFGELHLEGFEVSHTKDGFRWDENEQPFLECLKEHLDSEDLPVLRQAEGHRARVTKAQLATVAAKAVDGTVEVLKAHLPDALPTVADALPVDAHNAGFVEFPAIVSRQLELRFRDRDWLIDIMMSTDESDTHWLNVFDAEDDGNGSRHLKIRVSLSHPFMIRFAQTDAEDVEAMLRVAAAISIAEVLARDSGVRQAGTIRRNVNDLLSEALAQA